MWFDWLAKLLGKKQHVSIICVDKSGREFVPFSVTLTGDTLYLEENMEE